MVEVSPLEKILNNPGLVHLAENIFSNLDNEKLDASGQINQSSKQILAKPIFWLRKFTALSKENQKDWMNFLQQVKNTDIEKYIITYLKWNLKKEASADLPCYSTPAVQDDFKKKILKICAKGESSDEDIEIVKILAPLTDNPNAPNKDGNTPIHYAAYYGHTEIVKILAPLTDNPNAPYKDGATPIYWAVRNGHTEIVQILAPLAGNPNAPDEDGNTPIHLAAQRENARIVKILALLTDNPNVPNKSGKTPCSFTKNAEIRGILYSKT